MGTKLSELRDGCFHAAMDDEPMFVLLARDPSAPLNVRKWADQREHAIKRGQRPASDMAKVDEARQCADDMETWHARNDGAWRTGLFAADDDKFDPRPTACRFRRAINGQPYPTHGCHACRKAALDPCPYVAKRND